MVCFTFNINHYDPALSCVFHYNLLLTHFYSPARLLSTCVREKNNLGIVCFTCMHTPLQNMILFYLYFSNGRLELKYSNQEYTLQG